MNSYSIFCFTYKKIKPIKLILNSLNPYVAFGPFHLYFKITEKPMENKVTDDAESILIKCTK